MRQVRHNRDFSFSLFKNLKQLLFIFTVFVSGAWAWHTKSRWRQWIDLWRVFSLYYEKIESFHHISGFIFCSEYFCGNICVRFVWKRITRLSFKQYSIFYEFYMMETSANCPASPYTRITSVDRNIVAYLTEQHTIIIIIITPRGITPRAQMYPHPFLPSRQQHTNQIFKIGIFAYLDSVFPALL